MSLDMSWLMQEDVLSEAALVRHLDEYFNCGKVAFSHLSTGVLSCDELFDTDGFIATLAKCSGIYSGIYDSEILGCEFAVKQRLSFRLDKERERPQIFNAVLGFVCYLFQKYPVDALLEFLDRDTCVFEKESGKIYIRSDAHMFSPKALGKYGILRLLK